VFVLPHAVEHDLLAVLAVADGLLSDPAVADVLLGDGLRSCSASAMRTREASPDGRVLQGLALTSVGPTPPPLTPIVIAHLFDTALQY
jgi:hypothetical protein